MKEVLYALPSTAAPPPPELSLTLAHMAYRITPGPRLTGVGLTPSVRRGAMYIAAPQPVEGDPLPCCRQVEGECRRRGFDRVILDSEGVPTEGMSRFLQALADTCRDLRLPLYLPEAPAATVPHSRVLISSLLVKGTLERRLVNAQATYGRDRPVLAVEAAAEDFLLPASGRGTPLSPARLEELLHRLEPAVFFDRGLCAHYFTYMSAGRAHFVLFDTARSVREKLNTAHRLGIPSALLAAPQVAPWLEEIFS